MNSSLLATSEARLDSFLKHIFSSKDIDLELILVTTVCITWEIRTDELMDSLFMLLEYYGSS